MIEYDYHRCTNKHFIQDTKFSDDSVPSGALHVKLMNKIQESISQNSPEIISNSKEDQDEGDKKQQN